MQIENTQTILLTGATGFLGTKLASIFVTKGKQVFALIRSKDGMNPMERLQRLWYEHADLMAALGTKIIPIESSLTQPMAGLSEADLRCICDNVDVVVHAAADVNINQTLEALRQANVEATRNVLDVALAVNKKRPLTRFAYVSTAYVAGKRTGLILENEPIDEGFNSLYEQTKFEAEQLVREHADQLPISIFRPAQIVGDSETGWITSFNTVYYPMKMYLKGKLPIIPVAANQFMNVVPVDYVASIIACAIESPETAGKTFHCTLPLALQPTVSDLVNAVRAWARTELDLQLPKPVYVNPPLLGDAGGKRNLLQTSSEKKKSFTANMLALAPYFNDKHAFNTANTTDLMGPCTLDWRKFLPKLLSYAVNRGFLKHSGRTAFEQMQVRLASKRFSLNYFDVTSDGFKKTTAQEMSERVRSIAAALRAIGLGRGDRIASAGVNSTVYTAVDAAIGLIGATSVPLYYTSPFCDIEELAQRSHAKLLFLGMPKLLREFAESDMAIPCVAMPPASENLPEDDRITPWDMFLSIGREHMDELDHLQPASYDDIATIRYTSGTTGMPKGTTFTQYQLVWMGHTMPEILDWKTRNGKMRYLSFLPMSHVVEGILVAYAPFYLLTDVEFYCLNDFSQLAETLPKVRPTIFFSVPRFYEKVWNQFAASGAGKRYLSMPNGPAKRAFGRICKHVILKRAGLDACRQLIVGSAPIRNDLLENYRELGIEIHNAFGLTEAPLITLNRFGKNDLGSLGQPLPETDVKVDEEGQIWMRGPQLTPGYDGIDTSLTDADGFFPTGDLGRYSAQGNLVIDGRIKELVVTSYGKNVQSEKMEALVKSIPGVSEAMLVGDGRPYCTAMVWMEDDEKDNFDAIAFDTAMEHVNAQVSHAEMFKRWAVMQCPLSLAQSELTPNLKLRRKAILEHYPEVLDALYSDTIPENVTGTLHVGSQSE